MADSKRVQALVESYAAQRESLLRRVTVALLQLWLPFGSWNKPDMVHAYSRRSSVIADTGVVQARRLARAFAVEMLREADALPDTLPPMDELYARSNVDIEQVYARPARQRSWAAYKEATKELEEDIDLEDDDDEDDDESFGWEGGDELPDADSSFWTIPDEEFEERIQQLIDDDMNTAANDEIQRTFNASPKVTGYRRIIHPELSAGGSCGLCVVASTMTYKKDDLNPMHGHCKCTILPITKDDDPGFNLSIDDLGKFYKDAGSTRGTDLKNTRYKIEMHGELGPTIVSAEHHWRGVDDVNRSAGRTMARPWTANTKEANKEMWARSLERAQTFTDRLTAQLNDPNVPDALEVADLKQAIEFNRDFIAYARRRAA